MGTTGDGMLVIHANWSVPAGEPGALWVWAESSGAWAANGGDGRQGRQERGGGGLATLTKTMPHPFAAAADAVMQVVVGAVARQGAAATTNGGVAESAGDIGAGTLTLRLPCHEDDPVPSPHLAHAVGHTAAEDLDAAAVLRMVTVPAVRVPPGRAAAVLEALDELIAGRAASAELSVNGNGDVNGHEPSAASNGVATNGSGLVLVAGNSLRFFATTARFLRRLLAQQRFVPTLAQDAAGQVEGLWQPWLADKPTLESLERLLAAMPPIARSAVDAFSHEPWPILEDFLLRAGDAACRGVMLREEMTDALEDRDESDPHVMWLKGLLGEEDRIEAPYQQRTELVKRVRRWLGVLEERAVATDWRLCLKLSEPFDLSSMGAGGAGGADLAVPGDNVRWTLSLHLENVQHPTVILDAVDIWSLAGGRGGAISVEGQRVEAPQEILLAELARAARLYKPLERLLDEPDPAETDLSTAEAYRFLREFRPILLEQGVSVVAPEWWDSPTIRLGARLQVESDPLDFEAMAESLGAADATVTRLGMHSLVSYNWQLAVGDTLLTLEQFEKLASKQAPLVMLDGRWVEIRPEDVKAAVRFLKENPGGKIEVGRALRLAYGTDQRETGLPILGMDATGWVDAVFGSGAAGAQGGGDKAIGLGGDKLPLLDPPDGFVGTLRPYQVKGMSWMSFMDRLGLGICLADDMGLGKTVQLLALLLHEKNALREVKGSDDGDAPIGRRPTLLIVPMSVVANWVREARRFTPQLKVHVHHGLDRPQGAALVRAAHDADVVVTTYALAHRDRDDLNMINWGRVVLDEAQNIKNPAAKQSRAIRDIEAPRRIALTGTPVENRLGELWAIMDFLNQDYFGPSEQFRRKFAVPIERYHDRRKADQLRGLVQPFILRRLKSDPNVITDLPEKVESKEYCYLTAEQASLYQMVVSDMLTAAEKAEGIQRRGVVLAGLIKLKQICNHPAHFMKEAQAGTNGTGPEGPPVSAARSGKCARLVEMLQEVLAAGDQALVFTQFRQAGHLLAAMLRHDLDREVLFLHGGTPTAQREKMIETFQRADGAAPVFILSLKAGGIGLNLTAANHVFHFDRWWNPAVEAQATDRAYRIGQTRTVQVHKFIVSGTLEERIDEMIESKVELAEQVIGSGEQWLTELDGTQLRELLALRSDAVGVEA